MNLDISKAELQVIHQQLPDLKKLIEEDDAFLASGTYHRIFISVFDHWLSATDSTNQIFIDDDLEELKGRRKKFRDFIEEVNSLTTIYIWRYKRHRRFHVQKPASLKDVLRKCDFNNLWSQSGRRYGFLLPEFSAIYAEEWDWTNIIWHTDQEKIEPLLNVAQKAGLHLLNN